MNDEGKGPSSGLEQPTRRPPPQSMAELLARAREAHEASAAATLEGERQRERDLRAHEEGLQAGRICHDAGLAMLIIKTMFARLPDLMAQAAAKKHTLLSLLTVDPKDYHNGCIIIPPYGVDSTGMSFLFERDDFGYSMGDTFPFCFEGEYGTCSNVGPEPERHVHRYHKDHPHWKLPEGIKERGALVEGLTVGQLTEGTTTYRFLNPRVLDEGGLGKIFRFLRDGVGLPLELAQHFRDHRRYVISLTVRIDRLLGTSPRQLDAAEFEQRWLELEGTSIVK